MKLCIITFTRDRLAYTKDCCKALYEKAELEYEHYVIDNGSTDGTQQWLFDNNNLTSVLCLAENIGISKALNKMKTLIPQCDYVLKFDNDCMPVTQGFLKQLIDTHKLLEKQTEKRWVLSPKVTGLIRQPTRFFGMTLPTGERIGETDTLGGICRLVPYNIFMQFDANEKLPKVYGCDGQFNEWCQYHTIRMGYCEQIEVEHYKTTEGQRCEYPDYYQRQLKEMQQGVL